MSTLNHKLANPHPAHKDIYDAVTRSLTVGPKLTFGEAKKEFGAAKLKAAMTNNAVQATRVVPMQKRVTPEGMYHPVSADLVGPSEVRIVDVTIEAPYAEARDTDTMSNHGVIG